MVCPGDSDSQMIGVSGLTAAVCGTRRSIEEAMAEGGGARCDVTSPRLAHAPDYRAACAHRSRPTAPPDQTTILYFPIERILSDILIIVRERPRFAILYLVVRIRAHSSRSLSCAVSSDRNQYGRRQARGPRAWPLTRLFCSRHVFRYINVTQIEDGVATRRCIC